MFRLFSRADPEKQAAQTLFRDLALQARREEFHTRFHVPDTLDGRFDLLALHGFLALEVLKHQGPSGTRVGTHLATAIFTSLDEALRDLGVGDIGISHRIEAMAHAFYGRLEAYRKAAGPDEMASALLRNLYRGAAERQAEAVLLAGYVLETLEQGRSADGGRLLLEGEMAFAPLPLGTE